METPKTAYEEVFCKSSELAYMFDVSNQWIGQLTRDGILKKQRVKGGSKYNMVESVRAYCRYLRDKAAGREEKTDPIAEKDKLEAEVRIKRAKADIAELEAKELQGQMHRSEDVEAITNDLVYSIRSALMALPGRLAVDVANASSSAEAATIIKAEVYKLLEELSNYRYDPDAYAKRVRERQKWAEQDEDDDLE